MEVHKLAKRVANVALLLCLFEYLNCVVSNMHKIVLDLDSDIELSSWARAF
jgi:hypothetical protein